MIPTFLPRRRSDIADCKLKVWKELGVVTLNLLWRFVLCYVLIYYTGQIQTVQLPNRWHL
jgi:hypothetical protein